MATQPTFTCATCDVSIAHHPTFHLGLAFCCAGCAADGPCGCSYDLDEPALTVARTVIVSVPASASAAPAPVATLPAVTRSREPVTAATPIGTSTPALAGARR